MTEESVQLPNKEPTLRVVPRPLDTNPNGDIFGGWVMSQADIAGSIVAYQRARGKVVTIAVNNFVFKKPIFVGDVVSFYGEITKVGRTSITIDIHVYAQRRSSIETCVKVTESTFTYVAIDDNREPRVVPNES
jgi:acyl-CoA thioesterase YciA